MRKINPADVRTQFAKEVDSLLAHLDRVATALAGTSSEMHDVSLLASRSFLSLYVNFEGLCFDLFLAYLNRDCSQFQSDLSGRIETSITSKFGTWAQERVKLVPVKHVAAADLERAVDPKGRNLTFKSGQDIVDKAARWLIPAHRNRVRSLDAADKRVIDTAKAIRNFIAHQSTSSKTKMNDALARVTPGTHNVGLGRGVNAIHKVGAFLKSFVGSNRRIHAYGTRFKQIVAKM